jgi:hypothetical protein
MIGMIRGGLRTGPGNARKVCMLVQSVRVQWCGDHTIRPGWKCRPRTIDAARIQRTELFAPSIQRDVSGSSPLHCMPGEGWTAHTYTYCKKPNTI